MIRIYCDGSTKGNGKENSVGAWAFVLSNDSNPETILSGLSQFVNNTTNQRMELTAAIQGLQHWEASYSEQEVIVISDSAYLINCYQQKWWKSWQRNGWRNAKKQPVANQDLWEKLIPFFNNPRVKFIKVVGHTRGGTADERMNNIVDSLAQNSAQTTTCHSFSYGGVENESYCS